MKEVTKILLIGITVNILSQIIIRILDNFGVVNIDKLLQNIGINSIIFYILISILFFFVIVIIGKVYYKKKTGKPFIIGIPRRPSSIFGEFSVRRYGVDWKGVIGSTLSFDDPYAYVDGVYCPKCECELDRKSKGRFLRLKEERYWRCPECGFTHNIPEGSIWDLEKSIEKIAMNLFKKRGGDYNDL